LLPLGDAICSFNPVYGQGMTVAALEARLLGDLLATGTADLGRLYLREAAKIVETPWQIAVGSDLRYADVKGRRPLASGLVNAWLDRVHRAARHDAEVTRAFHRVANLFAPPASLFSPAIVRRVLWPQCDEAKAHDAGGAELPCRQNITAESRW
jgi:2-polyprenyl-6-methoxyphenol hydroxylase-like FAD-dependent oxidoreductase